MSLAVSQIANTQVAVPSVVCVVLNWNGWRDTIACLDTLAAQTYPALHVVIVDNASTDGSVARIREAFPAMEVVESGRNDGFAAGCNAGIRVALERGADFVWLLNNDTLAPPDTLAKLVAAGASPKTGIVGTVLYYADNPEKVQAWGGGAIIRSIGLSKHYVSPTTLGPDTFLTFASVLLRAEMLEDVGLLDELYFMYFEDADLCFRARDAGWNLTVAADTALLHKEGGTSGTDKNPRSDRIVTASGVRFTHSHGRPKFLAPVLFILFRLGKRLLAVDFGRVRAVFKGVGDWWNDNPTAFQKEL